MSGQKGLNEKTYVDNKLLAAIANIDQVSKKFFLNNIATDPEVATAMNMTSDILDKMNSEELRKLGYHLSILGFNIQRTVNRSHAIKNWANRLIETLIGNKYHEYDVMIKYEVKRAMIVRNDEYGVALQEIFDKHCMVCDDMDYLSSNIKLISDMIDRIARNKEIHRES